MPLLFARIRLLSDIFFTCLQTAGKLIAYCVRSIAQSKFTAIRDIARDVQNLLIWRTNHRVPSHNHYQARNEVWVKANEAYHEGDWESTKALLLSADVIEDRAAILNGLDSFDARLIGRNILGSIGHMSFGLALRARIQVLGDASVKKYITIGSSSANDHFLGYWTKYFNHLDCNSLGSEAFEDAIWPILESIQTVRTKNGNFDLNAAHNWYAYEWERLAMPPLLQISELDLDRLNVVLAGWGLKDRWVVTLHVRWSEQGQKYGRNGVVDDYIGAIKEIVSAGGAVVRLGSPAMPKLPKIEGLVDYAHLPQRTPWLDVALIANSRFMIATTSGPIGVAHCFGIPILLTNAPDIAKAVYHTKTLMIPKMVRHPDGHILSISEMYATGAAWMDGAPVPHSLEDSDGYSWVANTPEDILEGTKEMLQNGWQYPEDEIGSLWRERLAAHGAKLVTRPSPSFLRKNTKLIFNK